MADGFDETGAVAILTTLRQAGLCVKSVGLTRGPVNGVHGVSLVADLTLADLERCYAGSVDAVILPEGEQGLARLENDPRVHRLLRQVVAGGGWVAIGAEGMRVARAAGVWAGESGSQVLLRTPEQSDEAFTQALIRALKWSPPPHCQEGRQAGSSMPGTNGVN
jgi:putative intracellular protease/amidase